MIVPTSSAGSFLQLATALVAFKDVILVALCSQQAKSRSLVKRVKGMPGPRALTASLPKWSKQPQVSAQTLAIMHPRGADWSPNPVVHLS